ncbi:hypothetical protein BdWA1_001369 [Babesia duncani]|uniref:Uncharacterized protein n=1 Tax=Babesia duncani TaxID=323732 RepID=A0AAD9UQX3_9APIC|nr:hypothetical protein BdWA1_001369 [Babesia duncani]
MGAVRYVICGLVLLLSVQGYNIQGPEQPIALNPTPVSPEINASSPTDSTVNDYSSHPGKLFSWFTGAPKTENKKYTSSLSVQMVSFANIRNGAPVEQQQPFIEIQKTNETFASSGEYSLLHFVSGQNNTPKNAKVTNMVLTFYPTITGEVYGDQCPSGALQVSLMGPDGQTTVGTPAQVKYAKPATTFDMTPMVIAAGPSFNVNDFKVKLEANTNCYVAISIDGDKRPHVEAQIEFWKSETIPDVFAPFIMPVVIVGIVALSILVYRKRTAQTDYTYFYDNAESEQIAYT